MAVARLASQGGWGKEPPPPTILKSPCAVQGQRRSPSPHPQAAARHRVTNGRAYDVSLRQRGSLTVWFTKEAIAAWRAEPRTTRGGQPWYSPLAILTALTRRTVFRLALRQTEGLLGSILHPCSASSLPCLTTRHSAAGLRRCGCRDRGRAPGRCSCWSTAPACAWAGPASG